MNFSPFLTKEPIYFIKFYQKEKTESLRIVSFVFKMRQILRVSNTLCWQPYDERHRAEKVENVER